MSKISTYQFILIAILFWNCKSNSNSNSANKIINIDSLSELIEFAAKDNMIVKMQPGVYNLDDSKYGQNLIIKKYDLQGKPKSDYPITALINFSGNNNQFLLDGVVLKINSELHQAYGENHIFEIFVSGNNNKIEGLNVQDKGHEAPLKGAIMMHVMGDDNTITNVGLFIKGSYPYGYGHLLGKGAKPLVKPRKHSSLLVSGKNTKLIACRVVTHGFGHGIVMQGAQNTLIKDCYVEGKMRSTDEMLAETSGPAFSVDFKSDYPPGKIIPNEIKALSEDGVRSYPYGYLVGRKTENITVINTTVKNMRSGFDLSAHIGKTLIDGCTALECQEKGYSVSKNAIIKNSKGDAMYGPLLSFHQNNTENCNVELELINTVGSYPVKRLMEINGTGHKIKVTNFENKKRTKITPIVFGESFWSDVHKYRYPNKDSKEFSGAYNITLINETGMPIEFGELSKNCKVITNGKVLTDLGENNKLNQQYEF